MIKIAVKTNPGEALTTLDDLHKNRPEDFSSMKKSYGLTDEEYNTLVTDEILWDALKADYLSIASIPEFRITFDMSLYAVSKDVDNIIYIPKKFREIGNKLYDIVKKKNKQIASLWFKHNPDDNISEELNRVLKIAGIKS